MHTFSNYSQHSAHLSTKYRSTLDCDGVDCGDPCSDNRDNDCNLLHEKEANKEV